MAAPYTTGQPLAWMVTDPDGIRVHRARVEAIQQAREPDHWEVTTDHGTVIVDDTGASAHAVPLDSDIEQELYIRGDGYVVTQTVIEHTLDQDTSIELGDDLGLD